MDHVAPTITEDMFKAYEAIRVSGVTNMFDLRVVCHHSGLSREEVLAIMKHYRALTEQYSGVRKP